jgi:hypothetical protein
MMKKVDGWESLKSVNSLKLGIFAEDSKNSSLSRRTSKIISESINNFVLLII